MPITKVVKSGYKSPEEMSNLIGYIVSEERHAINGLTGGKMIFTGSAESVYEQMMVCKQYFHKTCGRYMQHVLVSFSEYEMKYIGVNEVYKIAMQICNFFRWHQTIFAIHQETNQLHIHIGINTVSFLDGRKLRFTVWDLRQYVQRIVDSYVPFNLFNIGMHGERRIVETMDELETLDY